MNSKSINKILFVINGHQFTAKHRIPLIQHLLTLGYKVKCIVPVKSDAQKELIINKISTISWVASRKGLNPFSEIKSIFRNRIRGESSVNLKLILESLFGLFKLYLIKKSYKI